MYPFASIINPVKPEEREIGTTKQNLVTGTECERVDKKLHHNNFGFDKFSYRKLQDFSIKLVVPFILRLLKIPILIDA